MNPQISQMQMARMVLVCAALAAGAWAAGRQYVTVIPPAGVTARPGDKVEVSLDFIVTPGYHINSNKPTFEYMIATRLEWASGVVKHLGDTFPPAQLKAFGFSNGKKLAVFEGPQTLKSRFAVPGTAPAGKQTLEGKLRYQACDHQACYPPNSVDVKVTVEIRKDK